MPKRSVDHFIQAIAVALTSATLGLAQQPSTHGPLNLVAPNGIGRIIIPAPANDVQWSGFNLYDQGARPVFETRNPSANLIVRGPHGR